MRWDRAIIVGEVTAPALHGGRLPGQAAALYTPQARCSRSRCCSARTRSQTSSMSRIGLRRLQIAGYRTERLAAEAALARSPIWPALQPPAGAHMDVPV